MTTAKMRNIGPKSAAWLRQVGLRTLDDLAAVGTVEAFMRVKRAGFKPGLNLLYAIEGALLDCHCNWTAAWHLMQRDGLAAPPCTVTASYAVELRRPTPSAGPLRLSARPVSSEGDRVVVEGTLEAGGKICDTFRGTFVAVKPGHPAYHRW